MRHPKNRKTVLRGRGGNLSYGPDRPRSNLRSGKRYKRACGWRTDRFSQTRHFPAIFDPTLPTSIHAAGPDGEGCLTRCSSGMGVRGRQAFPKTMTLSTTYWANGRARRGPVPFPRRQWRLLRPIIFRGRTRALSVYRQNRILGAICIATRWTFSFRGQISRFFNWHDSVHAGAGLQTTVPGNYCGRAHRRQRHQLVPGEQIYDLVSGEWFAARNYDPTAPG